MNNNLPSSVLKKHYFSPLKFEDLNDLPDYDDADEVTTVFDQEWCKMTEGLVGSRYSIYLHNLSM